MTDSPHFVVKKNTRRPSGTIPAVGADLGWIDRLHRLWQIPRAERNDVAQSA
jgi:hypothetical protein